MEYGIPCTYVQKHPPTVGCFESGYLMAGIDTNDVPQHPFCGLGSGLWTR